MHQTARGSQGSCCPNMVLDWEGGGQDPQAKGHLARSIFRFGTIPTFWVFLGELLLFLLLPTGYLAPPFYTVGYVTGKLFSDGPTEIGVIVLLLRPATLRQNP